MTGHHPWPPPPPSRWESLYWAVHRFWRWTIWERVSPRRNWRRLRVFWQRGRRGWADEDVWGLDSYLARVIAESTAHLAEIAHGCPISFLPDYKTRWDHTREESELAHAEWHAWLRAASAHFAAYEQVQDVGTEAAYDEWAEKAKTIFDNWGGLWD